MYKAVPDHPKFATFQAMLKLSKATAAGYLELMWHFAARFALGGNVGKFSDTEIEASLGWDGETGALIAALVASRWLDRSDVHRLVVHDWSHWAEEYVHTQLARKRERFADGTIPKSGRLNKVERDRFNAAFGDDHQDPDSAIISQESAASQPPLSQESATGPEESATAPVHTTNYKLQPSTYRRSSEKRTSTHPKPATGLGIDSADISKLKNKPRAAAAKKKGPAFSWSPAKGFTE
jgi:hypothetical protein